MFETPLYLFLLLTLFIFLPLEIYYLRKLKKLFIGEKLKVIRKKTFRKIFFYTLGFCSFVIALAQPKFGTKQIVTEQTKSELFFLLDISNSMNVADINQSRLDISKALIKLLNNEVGEIKTGLILFKGSSIVSLPLTSDKNIFDVMLEGLGSNSLSTPGTNIESACKLAVDNFSSELSVQKIILILSDGDETLGDIKKTAALLKDNNIICFCIGVGTSFGAEIKIYNEEQKEKLITTKLYEEELKTFIKTIGDKNSLYFRYDEINLVEELKKNIQGLNTTGRTITVEEKTNQSGLFLFLSLIFLIIGFLFGEHQWIKK